ncbi:MULTISPECIES: DNA polymerase III subunit beta [unclassified Granulicatella]|uniref:DNA polymerase III subunit beta n=1 Tax=unclassified Granulicatella TaxID=2630493 RepID=UPI00107429B2|nr:MULTISPECIES: DNA polymerase III subunit beta [unclassified Granulicatella]MBF0780920.1 DNA polymerase III subunit beta [Granulicatella sp. 19428wC4_WM01]TFU93217.1 DNA polymerase III subunit beta [Granulicatella sp. WM01]
MKFTINRYIFLKHLLDVQKAVTSKSTIPILTGIKLLLTEQDLLLTGSDASISIEKIISSQIEENELTIEQKGQIVLPSRFFGEIIKKLPGKLVTLTLLGQNKVEISSEKSVFTINGIDANLYPSIQNIDAQDYQTIQLPTTLLKNVFSQTVIAASTSENRPILTGIYLVIKNKQLIATATDSHRMSRRIIDLPNIDDSFEKTCTVPAKSLIELSKILNDEETVSMSISENKILFMTDTLYFYSRLLEGNYPDVSRLLQHHYPFKLVLNASTFLHSIERASILSSEGKNDFVTLHFGETVTLSSESSEIGYVEETIDYISLTSDSIKISFNPNYMKDALKVVNGQDIEISLQEEGKPFTIKLNNEDADKFIQLITPIRTRN